MSRKDWAVAVTVGLCAIGLLACGGSGGGSGSNAGDEAAFEESRLKMAECLRKHGVNAPDPVPGQGGISIQKSSKGGNKAGINPDDPATQKAIETCENEVGFEPPEVSPEQEEEMKEDMLAFAQCMRDNGVDMPDPKFGGGGKVTMQIGAEKGSPGSTDQPAVEAAQEACQDKMPGGGKGNFGFKAGP